MADKDFTQRELEIMAKAWACMTEEPKVDYDKLAAACGMGNPRSAGNAWRAIKTKIMAKGGIAKADGDEEKSEAAVKPTPKKRGRGKAEKDDSESPTKKPKETKGRKGKAAKEASAEADDEENGGSPVKGEPDDDGELN